MNSFFGVICNNEASLPPISLDVILNHKDREFAKVRNHSEIHISCNENLDQPRLREYSDKNILISLEGRIDNYYSLNKRILTNKANDEVDLIFKLYLKFGDKFASYLNGAFSICLRDKNKNRTLLIRDHLGLRPFYFFKTNEIISYGSDPNIIKEVLKLSLSFNREKILAYITKLTQETANQTYFERIESVPPRSVLIFEDEKVKKIKYFNFEIERTKRKEDDLISEFEDIFTNVIDEQIGTKDAFGTALSGGLDSSSITCVAAKVAKEKNKKISAYSAIFSQLNLKDENITNETKYSKLVAKQSGANHRIVSIEKIDVIKKILDSQQNLPEPNYHGNQYIDEYIFSKLNQDNVDIYLSGYDGDSVITYGYQKFTN